MSFRPPQFDEAAGQLAAVLHGLPGRLVAIDGRMGAGKTTLGRFLAWHFNITLIETDLFLLGNGTLGRRNEEIVRLIDARLKKSSPSPVLVDGVAILQLLAEVDRPADAHVYVMNRASTARPSRAVSQYEKAFSPRERANVLVELHHEG